MHATDDKDDEGGDVKVVFTTSGNDLTAPLDSRFGRAPKDMSQSETDVDGSW